MMDYRILLVGILLAVPLSSAFLHPLPSPSISRCARSSSVPGLSLPTSSSKVGGLPCSKINFGGGVNGKNSTKAEDSSSSDDASSSSKTTTSNPQWTVSKDATSAIYRAPSPQNSTTGIGGKDGLVYNVNRLKRNLVQETILKYKKELWNLLGEARPSPERVHEMLASLCQVNPVSTTTDSNLLDGSWSLVFRSNQPAKVLLRDNPTTTTRASASLVGRDILNSNNNNNKDDQDGSANEKKPLLNLVRAATRRFYLEELEETEDPHVVDCTSYFGGILSRHRYREVDSLTRRSLHLDMAGTDWFLLGARCFTRNYALQQRTLQTVQILYLDGDIMISVEQGDDDKVVWEDAPFCVYTKSSQWLARSQRLKRNLVLIGSYRPKVRRVLARWLGRETPNDNDDDDEPPSSSSTQPPRQRTDPNIMLQRNEDDTSFRVLKFGMASSSLDNAWEGEEDPFVHLTADERQKVIKGLSVKEIERMRARQLAKATRQRKKKQRVFERIRQFKKPTAFGEEL